ncbi:MAG: YitT family protein [Oscillospiraceae bacterium]|nr:YitT family protein [Oscillospiraceae bacterium]MBQ6160549.1 YitT family protein [Oscillospiraceae bacterium]
MRSKLKSIKINPRTLAIDILFDIIGCTLYGAGIFNFAYAANFAPGGVSGLAILINTLTKGLPFAPNGIPIGTAMLLINIPVIILCFKALGPAYFARSVKTMLFSSLIVDYLMPHLWIYQGDPMLAAIFGGILAGAGLTCIYLRDSSTGGSDFVILAIQKKRPQLSLGVVSLAVDGVVILLGGIVYGTVDAALYGLIMTITYSIVIDKIMMGNDSRKMMTIITSDGVGVSGRITHEIERGVTLLKGKGGFTGAEKDLLICACSKTEVFKIKRIVHEMDATSFVMVSSIDAAYGKGFKPAEP